tara:strand:- start:845 stop:1129 length:285 start_codon:yes stop_codon:yes gene_type:complete
MALVSSRLNVIGFMDASFLALVFIAVRHVRAIRMCNCLAVCGYQNQRRLSLVSTDLSYIAIARPAAVEIAREAAFIRQRPDARSGINVENDENA